MKIDRKYILDLLKPFMDETQKDFDPEENLLANQYSDNYTPEYMKLHFGKLGKNYFHCYRASLAYAWYLLHFDIDVALANRILERILKTVQVKDKKSEDYGELFWFMEEKHIRDRNGNFFNGSTLVMIYSFEFDKLKASVKKELKNSLSLLYPVFEKERAKASLSYVNPTLGKFAMCFLLSGIFKLKPLSDDKKKFMDYIGYLLKNGVNESYTPTYTTVDIVILLMVFLISKDSDVRNVSKKILKDVFFKETAFFGDRFPAPFRRGYNGEYAVFRDDIIPAIQGYYKLKAKQQHRDPYLILTTATLSHIAANDRTDSFDFSRMKKVPRSMTGRIYKDCKAYSYLSNNFLAGSINYYPPETTCWQCVDSGGSGWQDGPVYFTFSNKNETAAILRLEAADENGNDVTHPYEGKFALNKVYRLYPFKSFPPEPKLRCIQHEGSLLCLYKIDQVDAVLRKLGFNINFHRFGGLVRTKDGTVIESKKRKNLDSVIIEDENTWSFIEPLSRVDMANSCLVKGKFLKPSFDLGRRGSNLDLMMYNCNSKAESYTQNHICGGFFIAVKEKKDIGGLGKFLDFVKSVKVEELYYSERINAHIDKRDSIRKVTVSTPEYVLELSWDHYNNTEISRRIKTKE